MFLYLETCFLRVTVSLLCRLQALSKIRVPIYPYLIIEGRRNCSALWPAQQRNRVFQETCYRIWKHAKMEARIFQKNENRGIKITWVNSILITKSINLQLFTLILYVVMGPLWWWHQFPFITSTAQSIYREVYAQRYFEHILTTPNRCIMRLKSVCEIVVAKLPVILHTSVCTIYPGCVTYMTHFT